MADIDTNTKAGTQGIYSATTEYSAEEYHIRSTVEKMLTTGFLARIDSCTSTGEGGTKTVNATPLIQQTNAEGVGLPTPSFPVLPHYRAQGGIGAFIVDPVPGDVGVFLAMKADSSSVTKDTSASGVPASYRKFDPAGSMMVATVHTKDPQVWIHIKQDKTIVLHAPEGYTVETDKSVTINAGQNVTVTAGGKVTVTAPQIELTGEITITGNLTVTGTITSGGSITSQQDVSASSVSFLNHTHSGVTSGSNSTGIPNR